MLKSKVKAEVKLKKKHYAVGISRESYIKLSEFSQKHEFTKVSVIDTAIEEFIKQYEGIK